MTEQGQKETLEENGVYYVLDAEANGPFVTNVGWVTVFKDGKRYVGRTEINRWLPWRRQLADLAKHMCKDLGVKYSKPKPNPDWIRH